MDGCRDDRLCQFHDDSLLEPVLPGGFVTAVSFAEGTYQFCLGRWGLSRELPCCQVCCAELHNTLRVLHTLEPHLTNV